jgi:hypothetical protein
MSAIYPLYLSVSLEWMNLHLQCCTIRQGLVSYDIVLVSLVTFLLSKLLTALACPKYEKLALCVHSSAGPLNHPYRILKLTQPPCSSPPLQNTKLTRPPGVMSLTNPTVKFLVPDWGNSLLWHRVVVAYVA